MPPVRSGGTRTKRESLVENAPASSAAHPAAHAVLARIFHDVRPGLRYRLWDGSAGEVGRPDGSFTIVIGSAGIFRKAFSRSDTGILAEAYATGEIDIEGDIRACLRIAAKYRRLALKYSDDIDCYEMEQHVVCKPSAVGGGDRTCVCSVTIVLS